MTSSSNVRAIGYDPSSSTLYVEFATTGTYYYLDVPQEVYQLMQEAPSKGRFVHEHLVGRYAYGRL